MKNNELLLIQSLHSLSNLIGGVEIKFFTSMGEGIYVNRENRNASYCAMMFASPYGYRYCTECDNKWLGYAKISGKPIKYKCHMNLTEIIFPIHIEEKHIGSFFYGQFHEDDESIDAKWERIAPKLKEWKIDVGKAKTNYFSLPVFSEKKVNDIMTLLTMFVEACKSMELYASEKNSTIDKIDKYIEDNMAEKISLEQIAQFLHMSPSYLSTYFKKNTNITLFNYIQVKRIRKACVLLKMTDESIRVVGNLVGFEDQNYFSKAFAKVMKTSPLNYRNSFRLTLQSEE